MIFSQEERRFLGYTARMSSGYRKAVALVVLLWAFTDLTVPGVCQADDNKVDLSLSPQSILASAENTCDFAAFLPEPGDPIDECFCCSTRVIPNQVVDTSVTQFVTRLLPDPPTGRLSRPIFTSSDVLRLHRWRPLTLPDSLNLSLRC